MTEVCTRAIAAISCSSDDVLSCRDDQYNNYSLSRLAASRLLLCKKMASQHGDVSLAWFIAQYRGVKSYNLAKVGVDVGK